MIKAYLDTNVLVDYFAQRQNFFVDATTIVSLAINKKIKPTEFLHALISPLHSTINTFSNIYNLLKLCYYPPHRPLKVIL